MTEGPHRFLCRDCLTDHVREHGALDRCPACGSPRLISHPERDSLSIAHVDCDAFYASIEKRDDPSLADKPVIVGGGRRGVVSTACYVARTYGVRSAMPMFKALKACPDAVVIRPNMEKYVRVGREVRRMMLELTPLVEPLSIDEAFLDLSGTERLHHASPAATLAAFARRVETEIGITVSIGLAPNKFLAKIASDLDKPRGFSIIGRREAADFLADKPVSLIHGVGKVAEERLAKAGFRRIRDLRDAWPERLTALLGREGPRLHRLAHGIDDRMVDPERETKSISAETTFEHDIADPAVLVPILWRLSEKLSARLKHAGLAGRTVTLKLKTADFRLRTRSRTLPATQLASRLFEAGRDLLQAECDGTAFRLLGIGATEICAAEEADLGDLADQDVRRARDMERAVDTLRERFGAAAVVKGIVFKNREPD
ncbi:DNA polymerase IV [Chelatococcus sp. SYSU_G07232]|uniref:DNA polymerase IV n=1 Tax=Chelatococcus albus TaxID=3047466 RepID=A0ABT7ACX0_9HYPH|nr:DNA polymerase IV [Chelatococcus sp. SYSU_G07232]MDJ1157204.1 DNA polymerase IV [Chelatococcus sp. SYSU_G07232]